MHFQRKCLPDTLLSLSFPISWQARDERVSVGAKLGSLREDVRALWDMLGNSSEEEEAVVNSLEGKPLRVQVGVAYKPGSFMEF